MGGYDDFKDLKDSDGPIEGLRLVGFVLKAIQHTKVTSIYILRQESFTANGDPQYLFTDKIFGSSLEAFTGDNTKNVVSGMFPKGIKMNHYLSDADAWFVRTNVQDGMKCYQRMAIEFGQDNDFDTKNAKAASLERYIMGYTDWRSVFGTPGA